MNEVNDDKPKALLSAASAYFEVVRKGL
jgi:hypothetical protein